MDVLDFSGKEAFYIYKVMCENFDFTLNSLSRNAKLISQVVFHGMFSTYLSNLAILEKITNCKNWERRENMTDVYKKVQPSKPTPGTSASVPMEADTRKQDSLGTRFSLIKFVYVSK